MAQYNQGHYPSQYPHRRQQYQDEYSDPQIPPSGASQPQYPSSNGYTQQSPASYAPAPPPRPASYGYVSGYGDQIRAQVDSASPTTYNPQQYPQVAQYNPQAYSAVSAAAPPPLPPKEYDPAAYTGTYGASYHTPTYSPVQYASPLQSPQRSSFARSTPSVSYQSPRAGYTSQPTYTPSNASPRPTSQEFRTSTISARPQTYSTYSQPAPQMVSYASPSPDPPRHNNAYAPAQDPIAMPDFPNYSTSPSLPLPGLPPDELHLPDIPAYAPANRPSFYDTRQQGPLDVSPLYESEDGPPSPPPPAPPHRSGTIGRHPHSRPLPGPPEPDQLPVHTRTASRDNFNDCDEERRAQDELFNELENAVMNAGSRPSTRLSTRLARENSIANSIRHSPRHSTHGSISQRNIQLNGHRLVESPVHAGAEIEDDDEDPEALAGLEAMRVAEEEEEQDARRRQSGQTGLFRGMRSVASVASIQQSETSPDPNDYYPQDDEDEDYGNVDMSLYSGGYEAPHMSYGNDPAALAYAGDTASTSAPSSRMGSFPTSQHDRQISYDYGMDTIHPPPAYPQDAHVEYVGTGGLEDPNTLARRKSYDEDDEFSFNEEDLVPSEPPDLFYHPGLSTHRPLPPPPSVSEPSISGLHTPASSAPTLPPYPLDPSAYVQLPSNPGVWVPRSASLIQPRATPSIERVARSKTDADDRVKRLSYRASSDEKSSFYLPSDIPAAATPAPIDLPSLGLKRFSASRLGAVEFRKCEEPWALSSIHSWFRQVAPPEEVSELKEAMIKDALVALLSYKVPTLNITDVEALADVVVQEMYSAGVLQSTEEWVRLCPGRMTGVLHQLTMQGCYSQKLHENPSAGRCYSYTCQRTVRKVDLSAAPSRSGEDWATFYKLTAKDVEGVDNKEKEVQNNLHEIVQTEDGYMDQLTVLQKLYRDGLAGAEPAVLPPKRLKGFLKDVFGKVDAVRAANEQFLLPQLRYRQIEQGPWIKGVSDIFRQWIRKARVAYIEYAGAFPAANLLMRAEIEQNLSFRGFIDRVRNDKLSLKLGWDTYLKAPITRLQRYTLLLATVHKNMKTESNEKDKLQTAIDEIKAVTLECDARVAEMQKQVDLSDLSRKLVLRKGMEVELNLNHLGRELIYRGELQRTGGNRYNWLDCQALLFDHYMILAKSVFVQPKGSITKVERYDVSRFPIPMDLLVLESFNDDAVMKSTYMRGITSVTTVSTRPSGTPDPTSRLSRIQSNHSPMPGQLDRTNNSASGSALQTTTSAPAVTNLDSKDSDKIVYPFKIKHLGREPYVLFAPAAANRLEWANKITEAKTRHAVALHAQNAEPFKLRVIADSAFWYDYAAGGGGSGSSVIISGTPIDRAIKEVEQRYKESGRPGPICRARVNCSASFTTPYPGKHMVAVGTDYGVYISEIDNPRGWTKAIHVPRVTQIAVLEEFNLLLLISSGALIAYHLDAIASTDGLKTNSDSSSARKAPQKLSGSRDVGFFAVGRMKERTLVFYKKRDGLSSTFKVLEPVFQKSTEKKRGMFKRGTTEFFRDFDEFYMPTECSGINLFTSSLAVSTTKGFEVLTLDKKQSFSVPDLKAPEVAGIATTIESQSPLGMLRLSEQEFLLCYERCAVYVNKHGDVSRSVIMNFVGRARAAALYGAFLVLFDSDFVEIRNAQNGRLKQIIAGREVKCLDDGGGGTLSGGSLNPGVVNGVPQLGVGSRTVKVAMQHPGNEKVQILVELVLNEGLKE